MSNIDRFLYVQNRTHEQVKKEIQNGEKVTHWMWYTFPQIKGLGLSDNAQFYGIDDLEEASIYLHHEILGNRLKELSNELLKLKTNNPIQIFGKIDAMKLRSSMTLFDCVEENSVFKDVLDKYYQGKKDELTLRILDRKK